LVVLSGQGRHSDAKVLAADASNGLSIPPVRTVELQEGKGWEAGEKIGNLMDMT